jgi:hypothetical protein
MLGRFVRRREVIKLPASSSRKPPNPANTVERKIKKLFQQALIVVDDGFYAVSKLF